MRESPEPTPAEAQEHQAVCNRLQSAAPAFQQRYTAIAAGLSHLEEVYMHERNAQARLLAEADKME